MSMDQINVSLQQFNTVTQGNASASEELQSLSEVLTQKSEQLINLVSFFQVENKKTRFR
jgi:methyl-accepting chemotaxis protein